MASVWTDPKQARRLAHSAWADTESALGMLLGLGCAISGHVRFGLLGPGSLSGTRLCLFLFTSQIISTLASRFQRQPSVSCTACTLQRPLSRNIPFASQADPAHFEIAHRCASRRHAPDQTPPDDPQTPARLRSTAPKSRRRRSRESRSRSWCL